MGGVRWEEGRSEERGGEEGRSEEGGGKSEEGRRGRGEEERSEEGGVRRCNPDPTPAPRFLVP